MSSFEPSSRMPGRGLQKYLYPNEEVRYLSRRHLVSLRFPFALWLAVAAYLVMTIASGEEPVSAVGLLGPFVFLVVTMILLCSGLQWWEVCYVFTNERILQIEGVFSRNVVEIPFRMVIDSSYRRTFLGRLLGYGDLVLNLSGQPNLRTLEHLPNSNRAYGLFLTLVRAGQ